jgi:Domain of unknown function (DUF4911)
MLDLIEIYVRLRPEDIAYLKFIFESYETVGFLRTIDPKAATLVIFLVPDFAEVGRGILDSVSRDIEIDRIDRPADLGDDWLVGAVAGECQSCSSVGSAADE